LQLLDIKWRVCKSKIKILRYIFYHFAACWLSALFSPTHF